MTSVPPSLDPSARTLAEAYRNSQLGLRAATIRGVISLWPLLRFGDLTSTYTRWLEAMRLLVERDRRSGYATTSGYLMGAYLASGNSGSPSIPNIPALNLEQFETSTRVTSIVAYRRGISSGMTERTAIENALVQAAGSASRLVLEAGRTTLLDAAGANNARWGRFTSPSACTFCRMLAGRGFVYRSEATGSFDAHDHCGCSAAIDFTPAARAA